MHFKDCMDITAILWNRSKWCWCWRSGRDRRRVAHLDMMNQYVSCETIEKRSVVVAIHSHSDEESELSADEQPSGPRESSRPTKGQPPKRYGAMIARVMTLDNEEEPITYQQAINHPYHGKEWEIATQEEYDQAWQQANPGQA